jgi:hypothetical protein
LKAVEGQETLEVIYPGGLRFTMPRDLLGLLHGVQDRKTNYLRPKSKGLALRYRDSSTHPVGGPIKATITKAGPLACALRFEGTEAQRGVKSVVEMDFPRSKSWVRVAWTIQDPEAGVTAMGTDLLFDLTGEPTLVDFGAGGMVYAALRPGQSAEFLAGTPASRPVNAAEGLAWQVLTGPTGAMTPYVVAPRGGQITPTEGWLHLMDRQRCTAVAVEGFGQAGRRDRIEVSAEGRLQLWRDFAVGGSPPPAGRKTLTFFLHFVGMPVHVGAATSPQSMLAPLRVDVLR